MIGVCVVYKLTGDVAGVDFGGSSSAALALGWMSVLEGLLVWRNCDF